LALNFKSTKRAELQAMMFEILPQFILGRDFAATRRYLDFIPKPPSHALRQAMDCACHLGGCDTLSFCKLLKPYFSHLNDVDDQGSTLVEKLASTFDSTLTLKWITEENPSLASVHAGRSIKVAIWSGRMENLKVLLDNGIANSLESLKELALMTGVIEASILQCLESFLNACPQSILRYRDLVNSVEPTTGNTLLINAAWATNVGAVDLLLRFHANVNTVNAAGETALDHVRYRRSVASLNIDQLPQGPFQKTYVEEHCRAIEVKLLPLMRPELRERPAPRTLQRFMNDVSALVANAESNDGFLGGGKVGWSRQVTHASGLWLDPNEPSYQIELAKRFI